jgi:hypothetical protein
MYSLAGEPHHPYAGLSKCFFSVREKALKPKKLIILDGSAHAQFLFQTGQGELVMREILRFLSAQ